VPNAGQPDDRVPPAKGVLKAMLLTRLKTALPLCKSQPLFFMVDLATGGGWPVDLSRYDGRADMYVDYVRVYRQER
jgi:hypothetical protein